jgi:hypothetical protein
LLAERVRLVLAKAVHDRRAVHQPVDGATDADGKKHRGCHTPDVPALTEAMTLQQVWIIVLDRGPAI